MGQPFVQRQKIEHLGKDYKEKTSKYDAINVGPFTIFTRGRPRCYNSKKGQLIKAADFMECPNYRHYLREQSNCKSQDKVFEKQDTENTNQFGRSTDEAARTDLLIKAQGQATQVSA